MDALKVSLIKPRDLVEHVSMWYWNGSALDEGAIAAEWFSKFLGNPYRLVRFDQGNIFSNTISSCSLTVLTKSYLSGQYIMSNPLLFECLNAYSFL